MVNLFLEKVLKFLMDLLFFNESIINVNQLDYLNYGAFVVLLVMN